MESGGSSLVALLSLLIAGASLVAEHRLWVRGVQHLQSVGSTAAAACSSAQVQ